MRVSISWPGSILFVSKYEHWILDACIPEGQLVFRGWSMEVMSWKEFTVGVGGTLQKGVILARIVIGTESAAFAQQ